MTEFLLLVGKKLSLDSLGELDVASVYSIIIDVKFMSQTNIRGNKGLSKKIK